MTNDEIINALKPAFPDVYPMNTGGGIICPSIPVGPNGAYALVTWDEDALVVGFYDWDRAEAEGREVEELVQTGGTIEEAIVKLFALRARFDIWADFEPEEVADVHNFVDLQDICDANVYLEPAFTYFTERYRAAALPGADHLSESLPFVNAVGDAIEALGTFGKEGE